MSKTSAKQRITQLMEWKLTTKFGRIKPVKTEDTIAPKYDYNIRIKNM